MNPMQNTSKKQPDEKLNISNIFKPGTAVDVVFDMDADIPVVRSSIIHDCNYEKSQIIISQPNPQILPSFTYDTMTVTTIVEKELNEKFRCGINATISSKIVIVRKKLTASNKIFFLGMKFLSLGVTYEKVLSKFIHEAQIKQIKHAGKHLI